MLEYSNTRINEEGEPLWPALLCCNYAEFTL